MKVKVSPVQAMEAHGGCGCKGPHIHSHGTRKEVGWLVLRSAAFTPRKFPGRPTHFIGGWVDPRASLDTNKWRKFPPLRHPGSNPGRPARSSAPCHLSHLAHSKCCNPVNKAMSEISNCCHYFLSNTCTGITNWFLGNPEVHKIAIGPYLQQDPLNLRDYNPPPSNPFYIILPCTSRHS